MKTKLFYVYYNEVSSLSDYSHPEIRIFMEEGKYCREEMISFVSQTNKSDGCELRKSYSLDMRIPLNYQHQNSVKLLAKITKDMQSWQSYSKGSAMKHVVKMMRKLGIERRMWLPIDGNIYNLQPVPRKFKNCSDLYWQAKEKGLSLKKLKK